MEWRDAAKDVRDYGFLSPLVCVSNVCVSTCTGFVIISLHSIASLLKGLGEQDDQRKGSQSRALSIFFARLRNEKTIVRSVY